MRFATDRATSPRLAELVASDARYDVGALAARVLLYPPLRADETPYVGVRAVVEEAAPARLPALGSVVEAVRALRSALEAAVADAMGDAPAVAVLAGGGVDSAGLLALAVRHGRRTGQRVFAVALDFETAGDDRPHMRALEAHLGCDVLRVAPEDAGPRLSQLSRGVDAAPFTWPSGAMEVEMLARARAHGATLALMGAGGDDLFDGEPRALAELARRGSPIRAASAARRLRGFCRPAWPVASWVARPWLGRFVPAPISRARIRRPWLPAWAGPALHAFADAYRESLVVSRPRTAAERHALRRRSSHANQVAALKHQAEVAANLERRDPFLHPRVIATVCACPPDWLLVGDERRGLFRRAVRDVLPLSVVSREDKAASAPALARLAAAGDLDVFARPLASATKLAALGLVDAARFAQAFDAWTAQGAERDWDELWAPLMTEGFLRARAGESS